MQGARGQKPENDMQKTQAYLRETNKKIKIK